nr:MAG TPA: hypothetical protein [Caudoviricetes sp.]
MFVKCTALIYKDKFSILAKFFFVSLFLSDFQ